MHLNRGQYKVRIKPAGWLVMGGSFFLLAIGIVAKILNIGYFSKQPTLPSFKASGFSAKSWTATSASNLDRAMLSAAAERLPDPGFEGVFAPVPANGGTASVTGELPDGWFDQSLWADVDVNYSADHRAMHSGKSCLCVRVGGVRRQAVQIAAPLKVRMSGKYRLSVWVKASRPNTLVQSGLRLRGKPYTLFGDKHDLIGTQWCQEQCDCVVTDTRYAFALFVVQLTQPDTTVWIDDADFTPI